MRAKLFLLFLGVAAIVAYGAVSGWVPLPGHTPSKDGTSGGIPPLAILSSPSVRWVAQAKPSERGRVKMSFKVEASSPLHSLQVKITPVAPTTALSKAPLKTEELRDVPTWLMGNKSIDWDGEIDLTGSLLAGQPVSIRVVATDEDKRTGFSEAVNVTLPERHFTQPVASALYTLRRSLQEDPRRRNEGLKALAGLLQQRAPFEEQDLTLLTLRSAAVRIALDDSPEGIQSALDLMWHAALLFEENPSNVTVTLRLPPNKDAPATKPE